MPDPNWVVGLLHDRMHAKGTWRSVALRVQQAAQGELTLPMPELDTNEAVMTGNLIVQGIDQTGMRIASVRSQTRFHPTRPGSQRSEQAARDRTAAFKAVHADNAVNIVDRKRSRWYVAYGSAPVVVRPIDGRVTWEARDPLTCFPAPSADPDAMMSDNCVFAIQRPWWWVRDTYPEAARMLRRPKTIGHSEVITLVEYVDGDVWGLYAASPDVDAGSRLILRNHGESYHHATNVISRSGPHLVGGAPDEWVGTEDAVTLVEVPNKAGLCPVVNPQRICLGRVTGQFDQMVDLFVSQARLMALELNAIEEAVYPPLYLVQRPNEQAEVVKVADGRRGILGEVRGGDLMPIQLQPGFQTWNTLNYLERAQKQNGGIPSEYSAENATGTRSGRQGELLLSAVVDFPIQEAHESFARSRWHENMCAIAVGKGNYGSKQFFFGAANRRRGKAKWTFDELFDTPEACDHDVKYPTLGADANGALIRAGQKIGLGLLSKETAREQDPEIDDPELEKDRIDAEAIEEAMRASIQQQAAQGAIPPNDIARIAQLVRDDRYDLAQAVLKVQQEAQERQAQVVEAGAPEAQPGLALPGAGAESQVIEGPDSSLAGMLSRLTQLRLPQRSSPAEQNAANAEALA